MVDQNKSVMSKNTHKPIKTKGKLQRYIILNSDGIMLWFLFFSVNGKFVTEIPT